MAKKSKHFICFYCGYIGRGQIVYKGSKGVEWFLWATLLIPGPFYSLWRHFTRYHACPKCKEDSLISIDTPEGRQLFERAARGQHHF